MKMRMKQSKVESRTILYGVEEEEDHQEDEEDGSQIPFFQEERNKMFS